MGKIISYITGSRAYGTPNSKSDVDLVVACYETDYHIIKNSSETEGKVMFGNLNIILFNLDEKKDRQRYRKWREVHEELVKQKPVTREQAIEAFNKAGVTGRGTEDSGP